MMKFIRHKDSASIHILENKIPEIKEYKKLKKILEIQNKLTYMSNTVLIKLLVGLFGVIWSS